MKTLLFLWRELSPLQYRRRHVGGTLFQVGPWACLISPLSGWDRGVFRNGSRRWSGWYRWREDAAMLGPCHDLCMCRVCWRHWTTLSRRERLGLRLSYLVHRGWWPL